MATKLDTQRTTITLRADVYSDLKKRSLERGFSTVNDAVTDAVEMWLLATPSTRDNHALQNARQIAALAAQLTNPYQILAAEWQLRGIRLQMTDIQAYRLDLDAGPNRIQMMKLIAEMMYYLNQQDEFWALTTTFFWRQLDEDPPAAQHPYLLAQEAAVARGMRLHRIFVIADEDFTATEYLKAEVSRQLWFQERLDQQYPGRVETAYVRASDLSPNLRTRHFGLIRRLAKQGPDAPDEGCVLVTPQYTTTGITELRLTFSEGSSIADPRTLFAFVDFRTAAEASADIRVLAKELDLAIEANDRISNE